MLTGDTDVKCPVKLVICHSGPLSFALSLSFFLFLFFVVRSCPGSFCLSPFHDHVLLLSLSSLSLSDHLALIIELLGHIPHHYALSGKFSQEYFSCKGTPVSQEEPCSEGGVWREERRSSSSIDSTAMSHFFSEGFAKIFFSKCPVVHKKAFLQVWGSPNHNRRTVVASKPLNCVRHDWISLKLHQRQANLKNTSALHKSNSSWNL